MQIAERINSFAELGELLRNSLSGKEGVKDAGFPEIINNQHILNPWFTAENVKHALKAIAEELTFENLLKWTNAYPQLQEENRPVKAGVIMAGNIPLAGFHDFLAVLISGNRLIAKTSSKDSSLIVKISESLISINDGFRTMIQFTDGLLKDFDIIIATGSNNSSRYFEHYFGRYPHIIRKNRNSIAVLDGKESNSEVESLGSDIFLYFGLGCRNVSKIYIPQGYDVQSLASKWQRYSDCMHHVKYANNYDFSKAVYLVDRVKFIDTGYMLLKEEKELSSPVGVIYYEHYDSVADFNNIIEILKDKIQCIVGHHHVPFGKAQSPSLWDYADGIDTLEFLLKKNKAGIL